MSHLRKTTLIFRNMKETSLLLREILLKDITDIVY